MGLLEEFRLGWCLVWEWGGGGVEGVSCAFYGGVFAEVFIRCQWQHVESFFFYFLKKFSWQKDAGDDP